MNRQDFMSGKEPIKTLDPPIVSNQIWESLTKMDFQDGRGEIDFAILIQGFNPILKKWTCSFHEVGGVRSISGVLLAFEMTAEEITKGFQYRTMWAPASQYVPIGPAPIPLNPQPFVAPNTVGNPWIYNNYTTANTQATGPAAPMPMANVSGTYVMGLDMAINQQHFHGYAETTPAAGYAFVAGQDNHVVPPTSSATRVLDEMLMPAKELASFPFE
jgi:hypothetical protein